MWLACGWLIPSCIVVQFYFLMHNYMCIEDTWMDAHTPTQYYTCTCRFYICRVDFLCVSIILHIGFSPLLTCTTDFLSQCAIIFVCFFTQTSKKDEKRNGDIIPPLPFYMRPTGLTLYMRQKLGSSVIQKGARSSNSQPIHVKNIPKPTGVCVWERERRGRERPPMGQQNSCHDIVIELIHSPRNWEVLVSSP